MYKITCEECKYWISWDDISGTCLLGEISTPGDSTCENAEEGCDDDKE